MLIFLKSILETLLKLFLSFNTLSKTKSLQLENNFRFLSSKATIEEEIEGFAKKRSGTKDLNVEPLVKFEKHYETFKSQAEQVSNKATSKIFRH